MIKDISLPVILAIVALCAAAGIASKYVLKMAEDNVIEEKAEDIIKDVSGYDVDLSPGSQESGR